MGKSSSQEAVLGILACSFSHVLPAFPNVSGRHMSRDLRSGFSPAGTTNNEAFRLAVMCNFRHINYCLCRRQSSKSESADSCKERA